MVRCFMRLTCLHRSRPWLSAAAGVVSTLAASAALAADQPRIVLHILDANGTPVAGTQVELSPAAAGWKPAPGGTTVRQKTNKKGEATFAFLPQGGGDWVLRPMLPEGQVALKAMVKTRDDRKRPIPGVDDREGALDPSSPYVPVQIHPDADVVDVALTVGPRPQPVAATGAGSDPGAIDVKDQKLKKEVFAAVQLIQANQYTEALAKVDELLLARADMSPEDLASVLYMRGFALYKLDRAPEAEAPLKEAVQLNPQFDGAFDLLANIYIGQKRYPEAADALQAELGLTQDPARRAPLLLNYALALREQGQHAEAVAPLEEALKNAPDDTMILVQLADTYLSADRAKDAEALIDSANLPPAEGAALHFNLAAAQMRSKSWAGAETHFRKAYELNPQLVDAQRYLADALLAQGKRDEAIVALEAYVAAAPNASDSAEAKQILDALKKEAAKKKKK